MKKHHLKLSIISLLSLIIIPTHFVSPAMQLDVVVGGTTEISCTQTTNWSFCCNPSTGSRVLAKLQVPSQKPISIEIVEKMVYLDGYWAFGLYDRQSDRLFMMSFPAIAQTSKFPEMYNQPFDQEHYIGAIAHEITHAIFHHNSKPIEDKWNNAAQEYLAHATQLGVLPAQRREEIISSQDIGPWESGDDISVTYMGFNPTGFAVKSYLHLTQMTDPLSFIQILLNHKWIYVSVP